MLYSLKKSSLPKEAVFKGIKKSSKHNVSKNWSRQLQELCSRAGCHSKHFHSAAVQCILKSLSGSHIANRDTKHHGRATVPIRVKSDTLDNKTTGGITTSIPEKHCHLLSNHIAQ